MAEIFRTPDDRFEGLDGYAFAPHYTELTGDLAGLRLHHVDEGAGDPILLLHGEPTWAYLYRKMIPTLAGGTRVIAPDYVGFGRSDKVTDPSWYSYDRHVESMWSFIQAADLDRITVVVQDWGGPIGLRLVVEHPERFARMVILNTWVFRKPARTPSPAFIAWRDFAANSDDLPIGMIVQGATTTELTPSVIAGYEAPFPTPASKAGAASFPALVPLADSDPGADVMDGVANELLELKIPSLVAFSDSDAIFSAKLGRGWSESLADSRFVEIEGAAHFLQEDRGERIADEIQRFIAATS